MSTGSHVIHWKLRTSAVYGCGPPPVPAQWLTVQWEGINHLTTLELKRHITQLLQLADTDATFDFILHNASTGEEYKDDYIIVHGDTSVIARRIDASRPRTQQLQARPTTGLSATALHADDDDQKLTLGNRVSRSTHFNYSTAPPTLYGPRKHLRVTHRVRAKDGQQQQQQQQQHQQYDAYSQPPPSYICYRCGQGDHFIRYCPTNSDPTYDKRRPIAAADVQQQQYEQQRVQKSFLHDVEDPKAIKRTRGGAAHSMDGGDDCYYTTVSPASSTPARYYTTSYDFDRPPVAVVDVDARLASRPDLLCPIDHRVLDEPTVVPCCFASFCRQCIERSLMTSSICPRCSLPLDRADLRPNLGLQNRIQQEREDGGRQQQLAYTAMGGLMPSPVYEEDGYETHRDARRGHSGRDERGRLPQRYKRRAEARDDGRDERIRREGRRSRQGPPQQARRVLGYSTCTSST